jgi:hypothetical protein
LAIGEQVDVTQELPFITNPELHDVGKQLDAGDPHMTDPTPFATGQETDDPAWQFVIVEELAALDARFEVDPVPLQFWKANRQTATVPTKTMPAPMRFTSPPNDWTETKSISISDWIDLDLNVPI